MASGRLALLEGRVQQSPADACGLVNPLAVAAAGVTETAPRVHRADAAPAANPNAGARVLAGLQVGRQLRGAHRERRQAAAGRSRRRINTRLHLCPNRLRGPVRARIEFAPQLLRSAPQLCDQPADLLGANVNELVTHLERAARYLAIDLAGSRPRHLVTHAGRNRVARDPALTGILHEATSVASRAILE